MIGGFLAGWYPWIKALHIVSIIAWMAGLFYLPRLFVYHAEGGAPEVLFRTMERRLLHAIMVPSMVASWLFGLMLVSIPGLVDWGSVWPWTKAVSVLGMSWFHFWLAARRRDFAAGQNRLSGRHYRMMNELPTVLMLVIVFSVVVKF
ncbi:MAG: CopD family protein [Gemmobacter sp.]